MKRKGTSTFSKNSSPISSSKRPKMIGDNSEPFRQLHSDYQPRPGLPSREPNQREMVLVIQAPTTMAGPITLPQPAIPAVQLPTGLPHNIASVAVPQPPPASNIVQLHARPPTRMMSVVPTHLPLFTQSTSNGQQPLSAGTPPTCFVLPTVTAPNVTAMVTPSPTNPTVVTPTHVENHQPIFVPVSQFMNGPPTAADRTQARPVSLELQRRQSTSRSSAGVVSHTSSASPALTPVLPFAPEQKQVSRAKPHRSTRRVSPPNLASPSDVSAMPELMPGFVAEPLVAASAVSTASAAANSPLVSESSSFSRSSSSSCHSVSSSVSCQPADEMEAVEEVEMVADEETLMLSLETLESVTEASTAKQVFTAKATKVLRQWVCRNIQYPYASKVEKIKLARESGLCTKQVSNWLTNARRRLIPKLLEHENRLRCERGLAPLAVITRKRRPAPSKSKYLSRRH